MKKHFTKYWIFYLVGLIVTGLTIAYFLKKKKAAGDGSAAFLNPDGTVNPDAGISALNAPNLKLDQEIKVGDNTPESNFVKIEFMNFINSDLVEDTGGNFEPMRQAFAGGGQMTEEQYQLIGFYALLFGGVMTNDEAPYLTVNRFNEGMDNFELEVMAQNADLRNDKLFNVGDNDIEIVVIKNVIREYITRDLRTQLGLEESKRIANLVPRTKDFDINTENVINTILGSGSASVLSIKKIKQLTSKK